jgi:hypothetical protein
LIHVDISKSNELRGQKGHQREITGQLQQNPFERKLEQIWNDLGQKIHLSLECSASLTLDRGKTDQNKMVCNILFRIKKKTAGQHFHQAGITNSGMISSAIQLFAEDF